VRLFSQPTKDAFVPAHPLHVVVNSLTDPSDPSDTCNIHNDHSEEERMKRLVSWTLPLVFLAAMAMPAFADDQPKMKEALESLEHAKQQLQQAEHDKGGHRAEAIKHIDQAIAQVKAGMAYDNKLDKDKKDKDHDHDNDKH
jgi:hypothetical protein